MDIKERVLSSLKTSYAKYGFKKEELSSLAAIISSNLTEESTDEDVTSAVTNAEGWAKMMQTVYNRGVSETSKKFEGYIPKPADPEPPKPEPPKPDPAKPGISAEDIQKMIAEGIAAGLKPYQEREEKQRLASILQGHSKLKDIPKSFREKYQLEKEEDLDTVVAKIESDYTALKQELVSSGQLAPTPMNSFNNSSTDDFAELMKGFSSRKAEESKK